MKILIHCEARVLNNGKENPKNYPYWGSLITSLPEFDFTQIGIEGERQYTSDFRKNLPFKELQNLISNCDSFICIDSFFQHLAWQEKKRGCCIFGISDPLIFGHPENLNIVNRKNLRKDQFSTWEQAEFDKTVFESPNIIAHKFRKFVKNIQK